MLLSAERRRAAPRARERATALETPGPATGKTFEEEEEDERVGGTDIDWGGGGMKGSLGGKGEERERTKERTVRAKAK